MTNTIVSSENFGESEHSNKVISMQKMLLERLLIKKELKLMKMEKKLSKVTDELSEAEGKLQRYESLAGLRQFEKISKACEEWITYLGRFGPEIGRFIADKEYKVMDIDYGLGIIILMTLLPDLMNIWSGFVLINFILKH